MTLIMIDLCSLISKGRPEPALLHVVPVINLLKVQTPELMFGQIGPVQGFHDL